MHQDAQDEADRIAEAALLRLDGLHIRGIAPPDRRGWREPDRDGTDYDLEEAIRAAHHWMRERDARDEAFLSGMFTRGEVVYSGSEAGTAHDREPIAIFTGEVLPLYAADLDDDAVRMMLNDLASEIGRVLEQEEAHVAYRDRTWTLKAVGEMARPQSCGMASEEWLAIGGDWSKSERSQP